MASDTYRVMSDGELEKRIANSWSPMDLTKALHERERRRTAYRLDGEPMSEAEFAEFMDVNGKPDEFGEVLDDEDLTALRNLQPGGHVVLGGGAGAECVVERVS